MAALLEAELPGRICAVISNRPDAKGLELAAAHGISTHVLDHKAYPNRAAFDEALAEAIEQHEPDLVVLAGFMRVLGEAFVQRFTGRLINIHPSLLPMFPGLHTHQQALQAGVKVHGCTVHFVTPALDHGPIIIQAAVPVLPDDDEDRLAARVLTQEHQIYPQAVRWFLQERLHLTAQGTVQLADEQPHSAALCAPALDA